MSIDVGSAAVDRVVIKEDLNLGQRIASYTVVGSDGGLLSHGKSVGNKRIDLFSRNATGVISLNILSAVEPPIVTSFAAFRACADS